MKRLILKISIVVLGLVSIGGLVPVIANAADTTCDTTNIKSDIECGTGNASGVPGTTDPTTSLNGTIASVINILSVVIGIIAVIMIVIAGFRYITSGGKQESVASAKRTITYAIIGLLIVAFAQFIARFTLQQATHPTTSASQGNKSSVIWG